MCAISLFAGKSRSIAIPENRKAAEERKKHKLTIERILEMKHQINTKGEAIYLLFKCTSS